MKRNIYGVTGYPTPDFTTERICRSFNIPNSTLALGAFMGALWELANEDAWQSYGDMTPAEAASMMQDIFWDVMTNPEGECVIVPAPYWDDLTADDADDQYPAPMQIWYGELVVTPSLMAGDEISFRDNLAIWGIAAFLAVTGNVAAAIAFVPIARRFVLAFQAHDLGGIVRVFIDAAMVGRVDTYAPADSVANLNVFMPDDDEPHTLWVAMDEDVNPAVTGTPEIRVIRKRLSEDEVYPENLRYDSDCDCVQQTYDGGETWVDQPGQDPRHAPQFRFPPVTADDPRCQAASNMVRYINDFIDQALGIMSISLDVLGLATGLLPALLELGPFALLFELLSGLSFGLVSLGVDVINSEFTNETYDALRCIFFCHLAADGSVSAVGLGQISTQIHAEMSADVALIMDGIFLLMGEVGMSNAGAIGDAPADCDDCDSCDWCVSVDFNAGTFNWVQTHLGGSPSGCGYDWGATWIDGQGWVNVFSISLAVEILLPAGTNITNVSYHSDTFGGTSQAIIFNTDPALQPPNLLRVNSYDTGAIDLTLTDDTYLGLLLQSPSGTSCGSSSQNIDSVVITGKGFKPDILIGDNC